MTYKHDFVDDYPYLTYAGNVDTANDDSDDSNDSDEVNVDSRIVSNDKTAIVE